MAHFDFVRPAGQWGPQMVPGASDFQRWDAIQAAAVSGDLGGTYAPTSPIILGGAGIALGGTSLISDGVATATGGRIVLTAVSGDYPLVSPARSRTIAFPLSLARDRVDPTNVTGPVLCPIPSRFLHDAALLVTIGVWYTMTSVSFSMPTSVSSLPRLSALLQSAVGGAGVALQPASYTSWSATTAASVGEYVIPSAVATNNGYYAVCITAGTTGATEPTWSTVAGTHITDGTAVWSVVGRSGILTTLLQTPVSLYNQGAAQLLAWDLDPAQTAADTIGLDGNSGNVYAMQLQNVSPLAGPAQQALRALNILPSSGFVTVTYSNLRPA